MWRNGNSGTCVAGEKVKLCSFCGGEFLNSPVGLKFHCKVCAQGTESRDSDTCTHMSIAASFTMSKR